MERMNTPELEEEKRCGPRNWGLEAIKVSELGCRVAGVAGERQVKRSTVCGHQGQEKVRRSSVDLRREIIDVGSIQRLIELRKQRRQRRAERAATPEPTPPPEPLEIVCQGVPRCGREVARIGAGPPTAQPPGHPATQGPLWGSLAGGPPFWPLSCTPVLPQA